MVIDTFVVWRVTFVLRRVAPRKFIPSFDTKWQGQPKFDNPYRNTDLFPIKFTAKRRDPVINCIRQIN